MPALVAGIHAFLGSMSKAWMAGTSPAMTTWMGRNQRPLVSYERWRSEFIAMGKALGGGSGWVLLTWSPRDRKLVNQWASDHCHTLAGATPILALDMYEHSYHMDFGAKAASYVDTFVEAIRWANADQLFKELKRKHGAETNGR